MAWWRKDQLLVSWILSSLIYVFPTILGLKYATNIWATYLSLCVWITVWISDPSAADATLEQSPRCQRRCFSSALSTGRWIGCCRCVRPLSNLQYIYVTIYSNLGCIMGRQSQCDSRQFHSINFYRSCLAIRSRWIPICWIISLHLFRKFFSICKTTNIFQV